MGGLAGPVSRCGRRQGAGLGRPAGGGDQQEPAWPDQAGVGELLPVWLGPVLVERVDLRPELGVAQVALGDVPQVLPGDDEVDLEGPPPLPGLIADARGRAAVQLGGCLPGPVAGRGPGPGNGPALAASTVWSAAGRATALGAGAEARTAAPIRAVASAWTGLITGRRGGERCPVAAAASAITDMANTAHSSQAASASSLMTASSLSGLARNARAWERAGG